MDDEKMREMAESVSQHGVLVPGIVRRRPEGGYELVSGHRRKRACELAGLPAMPVFVRELDDDEATLIMVDSNLQREKILPSEKALAYKMKLEAMKRQGKRSDLTSGPVGQKLSRDELAENSPDSARQIQRYIRLTYLHPALLQPVFLAALLVKITHLVYGAHGFRLFTSSIASYYNKIYGERHGSQPCLFPHRCQSC
ncbi:ParB/RepB/Spo0J family partition protein [Neglecta sp. X4]|nr:ParB/RepB/Spo0J family partition protein [Neglectibacter sp. X4]NCE81520.1 ParB/RepB/Spo0J family partition protein [Neglectibacter sp. X58]NCE82730.1 ParB/RepB/Spo0J family partition protein [Neglectibacter sp. X58]